MAKRDTNLLKMEGFPSHVMKEWNTTYSTVSIDMLYVVSLLWLVSIYSHE